LNNLQILSGELQWEEAILKWARNIPLPQLGKRLAEIMCRVTVDSEKPLLEAILTQYGQPDSSNRWSIFEQAQAIGFDTPVGALALAQFWSTGSMAPDELSPVYPEPHLCLQVIHCAMVLTACRLAENPSEGVQRMIDLYYQMEGR
jgi:hypothetical protein